MAEDKWLLTREQKHRVSRPPQSACVCTSIGHLNFPARSGWLTSTLPIPSSPPHAFSTPQEAEHRTEQRAREAARRLRKERQVKTSEQDAPRHALAKARAREQRRAALVAAQHREAEQRREAQRCGLHMSPKPPRSSAFDLLLLSRAQRLLFPLEEPKRKPRRRTKPRVCS